MTNRMELNLSNNLDSAVVTKVDLIFKQWIEITMLSQEIYIPEIDKVFLSHFWPEILWFQIKKIL